MQLYSWKWKIYMSIYSCQLVNPVHSLFNQSRATLRARVMHYKLLARFCGHTFFPSLSQRASTRSSCVGFRMNAGNKVCVGNELCQNWHQHVIPLQDVFVSLLLIWEFVTRQSSKSHRFTHLARNVRIQIRDFRHKVRLHPHFSIKPMCVLADW